MAIKHIEDEPPDAIAAAIGQLKHGHFEGVVDELDALLDDAHAPERKRRRATVNGISQLLIADPTTLVGHDAAQAFNDFRIEVCGAQTWLQGEISREHQTAVLEATRDGVEAVIVAVASTAVAVATGAAAPVVALAGAAAVAVVMPAVRVIRRIHRLWKR